MTNTSNDSTEPDFGTGLPLLEPVRITLICLGIIYTSVGVPGNALVIYTILRLKSLRVRSNMFIVNLMLADIILVGYIVPFTVFDLLLGQYPGNQYICRFNAMISPLTWCASLISIMFIAANRYIKMRDDILYEKIFSQRNTAMMCILPSLGVSGSMLFYVNNPSALRYSLTAHACLPAPKESIRDFIPPLIFLLVCVSTIVFYAKIFKQLRVRDNHLRNHGNETFSRIRHVVDRKFAISNFAIFVFFILFYLPMFSIVTLPLNITGTFHGIAFSLISANSALNWLVYGVANSTLRKAYKHIIPSIRRVKVTPGNCN